MKTATKLRASKVIRHLEFIPDGIHYFEIDASKRDLKHVQEICLQSGMVRCSCEDFTMRHASKERTMATPAIWCKHLTSAVDWLVASGDLTKEELDLAAFVETLNPCVCCAMPDAEVVVYDEGAHHIVGRMCSVCFEAKSRAQWDGDTLLIRDEIERLTAMREALHAEGDGLESTPLEVAGLNAQLVPLWRELLACEPRSDYASL